MQRDPRLNRAGVILYGPPAAGKDTVTAALVRLDPRYVPFPRLKVGSGRTDGYRLARRAQLDHLRAAGLVRYENTRYGNTYAVDDPGLESIVATGRLPVVHLGQVAGVRAVRRYPADWVAVLLWCSRESAAQRVRSRGCDDVEARLAAWDETVVDLRSSGDPGFRGRIDTDLAQPDAAAAMIDAWCRRPERGAPGDDDGL